MSFYSSQMMLNMCALGLSVYHGYCAVRECTMQFSDDHSKVNPSTVRRVKDLSHEVKIIAADKTYEASSSGVNMKSLKNNAAIRANRAMLELAPDGMNYFILRELYKIRQNTHYTNSCIKTLAAGCGALFGIVLSNSAGIAGRSTMLLLTQLAAGFVCSKNDERAIHFAVTTAKDKELVGALHIFEAMKKAAKRTESTEEEIEIRKRVTALKVTYNLDHNLVDKLAKHLKPSCLTRYGLKFPC